MKSYKDYTNRQTWIVALHLEEVEYFATVGRGLNHYELSEQIREDVTGYCGERLESFLLENIVACFISHVDFYQLADIHLTQTP